MSNSVTKDRPSQVIARRKGFYHSLILILVLANTLSAQTAQDKKSPAGKKATSKSPVAAAVDEVLITTDGAIPKDWDLITYDQTPTGKEKLADVLSRSKSIYSEREVVEAERDPLVKPRDKLLEESAALRQAIILANDQITREQAALNRFQKLQANGQNFSDRILQCQSNILQAQTLVVANQEALSDRAIKIDELNAEIEPFDKQLAKLFVDLTTARKEWSTVRQPQAKYAIGDFESLKTSLDEWVAIDTLWPDAHCWAALAAYELRDYEAAWKHADDAEKIRMTLKYPKAWGRGEALRGLIAAQIPERRGKSAAHLQSAALSANSTKSPDWQIQFLIGRAAIESERNAGKAKAGFTRALKINPNADCVKFWYARLQTTSTTPAVRDVEAGIKTLEQLWEQSSGKSWRLAQALVVANDAYDRTEEASKFWDQMVKLAPKSELENIQKARDELREKQKAALNSEATKSKSVKTQKKDTK